jgi:predicted RNA-binding Zn-ribbon protein involved in translation (DUF1610 family)
MAYRVQIIPDEKMPVFSEETLDKKFKPAETWDTTSGKIIKSGKLGGLESDILKLKANFGIISSLSVVPILIYADRKTLGKVSDDQIAGVAIDIFSYCKLEGKFYNCKVCKGYIQGRLEEKHEISTRTGGRLGNEYDNYNCTRCGSTLLSKCTMHRG